MIIKCDSYDAALNELEGDKTKDGATNIYTFSNDYGDVGYEEIVEVNGTYYVIEIYSMGDHLGSYTEHSFEDVDTAINEFNDVNHLTPI
ncbi:MAG: hypothetical protein MJ209_06755 [archaeon]|nr:hypothetical protein [archaeon]